MQKRRYESPFQPRLRLLLMLLGLLFGGGLILSLGGCDAYHEVGLCTELGTCSSCEGDGCGEEEPAPIVRPRPASVDHGPGDDTAH